MLKGAAASHGGWGLKKEACTHHGAPCRARTCCIAVSTCGTQRGAGVTTKRSLASRAVRNSASGGVHHIRGVRMLRSVEGGGGLSATISLAS